MYGERLCKEGTNVSFGALALLSDLHHNKKGAEHVRAVPWLELNILQKTTLGKFFSACCSPVSVILQLRYHTLESCAEPIPLF